MFQNNYCHVTKSIEFKKVKSGVIITLKTQKITKNDFFYFNVKKVELEIKSDFLLTLLDSSWAIFA